jgi:hypothetical protein
VDLLFAGRVALLAGQDDLLLQQGGGLRVPFGQRGQELLADGGGHAGQQQPGAGAAVDRERLAGLERDTQPLLGLDPVDAHRGPADEPDQDDGLARLLVQVAHGRIGHVDDALGHLGRPGQADEAGGEPVAAPLVAS